MLWFYLNVFSGSSNKAAFCDDVVMKSVVVAVLCAPLATSVVTGRPEARHSQEQPGTTF